MCNFQRNKFWPAWQANDEIAYFQRIVPSLKLSQSDSLCICMGKHLNNWFILSYWTLCWNGLYVNIRRFTCTHCHYLTFHQGQSDFTNFKRIWSQVTGPTYIKLQMEPSTVKGTKHFVGTAEVTWPRWSPWPYTLKEYYNRPVFKLHFRQYPNAFYQKSLACSWTSV